MLRNPNLAPLSRQHQHALALCVRIRRAGKIDDAALPAWQEGIQAHFEQEIKDHFAAEETVLFPVARRFPELKPLIGKLLTDHAVLRGYFARAVSRELNGEEVLEFAARLAQHIRAEERQLFEGLQQEMTSAELESIGRSLNAALAEARQRCALPPQRARK